MLIVTVYFPCNELDPLGGVIHLKSVWYMDIWSRTVIENKRIDWKHYSSINTVTWNKRDIRNKYFVDRSGLHKICLVQAGDNNQLQQIPSKEEFYCWTECQIYFVLFQRKIKTIFPKSKLFCINICKNIAYFFHKVQMKYCNQGNKFKKKQHP